MLGRAFDFLYNVVQNLLLKRQVGHRLLEPTSFKLQLHELADFLKVPATVFLPVPILDLLSQNGVLAGHRNALALTL